MESIPEYLFLTWPFQPLNMTTLKLITVLITCEPFGLILNIFLNTLPSPPGPNNVKRTPKYQIRSPWIVKTNQQGPVNPITPSTNTYDIQKIESGTDTITWPITDNDNPFEDGIQSPTIHNGGQ